MRAIRPMVMFELTYRFVRGAVRILRFLREFSGVMVARQKNLMKKCRPLNGCVLIIGSQVSVKIVIAKTGNHSGLRVHISLLLTIMIAFLPNRAESVPYARIHLRNTGFR